MCKGADAGVAPAVLPIIHSSVGGSCKLRFVCATVVTILPGSGLKYYW